MDAQDPMLFDAENLGNENFGDKGSCPSPHAVRTVDGERR